MPAKILFRDAQGRDGAVELRNDPVWIGRSMDCAIRTDDAMVSRKHSMISFNQGRYWVEDLGSSNGTHVNDVKVQRQALNHNDVVRCGSLWLRYVEEGPIGMGMGSPGVPGPMPGRTVAAPAADFGFASTVATPRTQAPPPSMGGGMAPPMESFGGGPRSVVVDMGGDSGAGLRYRQQADELRSQLDLVRAERDKEVAENKRMRAEVSNIQQRLDDSRSQVKEAEENIQAHKRVAEELRVENDQLKDRDHRIMNQFTELQEDLNSRTNQLQRAQADITKLKSEGEGFKKQLAELSRQKDEGFKKLNEQLAEVEHLREVIREQERMLEERRVGIISLEEAVKELRQDREGRIKEMAQMKAERDELRIGLNRQTASAQANEEENRRLGRLIQDLQAGNMDSQEVTRLSAELKAVRYENKRMDAEIERLESALRAAEKGAEKATADLSRAQEASADEVERLREAERATGRADEARIKAENAKSRAEEERAEAQRSRDELAAEVDKLRARVADLESRPAATGGTAAPARAAARDVGLENKLAQLTQQLEEAERRASEAARRRDESEKKLRTLENAAAAKPAGAGGADSVVREKAGEIYQSVNDVLAELRVNLNVVRDEFAALSGKVADPRTRTIKDAIEAAAGQTEDVKGVLRGLRELSEG
jgi:chromosome segregation ATPase